MIAQIVRVSLRTKNNLCNHFYFIYFAEEHMFFLEKWEENLYNTVLDCVIVRV